MSVELLLLSNSTNHGQMPWEHAREAARPIVEGRTVLFVPYASADHDDYTAVITRAFAPMGARIQGIHTVEDQAAAVAEAEVLYVGGGNTWRLLRTLQRAKLLPIIRERVQQSLPYLGASAGTNISCPTIRTTNDMPIVEPESFEALGLIDFQINPHYTDPDPSSTHMGETRQKRITEYLEENPGPVLGLREGSWLHVHDGRRYLTGSARLFTRDQDPVELSDGQLPF